MNPASFTAFVTGATGLLGNNLVRQLAARGVRVKALARSQEKAARQFAGLPVEIVAGDMQDVAGFAAQLRGVDVLFHTAAFFRDNYKGGRHRGELYRINVLGTRELLARAYEAGVRRVVHTSSTTTLSGKPGQMIDETMPRPLTGAADYPRSKILSDQEVARFLEEHADAHACMVLPGWMIGPGDLGPTSSGQLILDFMQRKLPGIPPAEFPVVDARDVAEAHIAAALQGSRGGRYIAAGRKSDMAALLALLEELTGVPAPKRSVPFPLLYAFAAANEVWHVLSGQPTLISLIGVRLMARERGRAQFDSSRAERELQLRFRPLRDTLRDTVAWYEQMGWTRRGPQPAVLPPANSRPA